MSGELRTLLARDLAGHAGSNAFQEDGPEWDHAKSAWLAYADTAIRTIAAQYNSCLGYEISPNPCRCPCYGCEHHCSAHQVPREFAPPPTAPTAEQRAELRQQFRDLSERVGRESGRNKIRQSFRDLAAQARETADHEGAAEVEKLLSEREEQWKTEDGAVVPRNQEGNP